MKAFLNSVVYELDIFKVPFVLLYKNREKSATKCGSLLSIAIAAIVLYIIASSNMLLKINPVVIDQTVTTDHAQLIELTPESFEVAAGVANSLGNGFSDPTIFKIQFLQVEIDYNETINSKQIQNIIVKKTQDCNETTFSDPNTFQNLRLANYTCLKNSTFELEGSFDEKMVKAGVVMISYCNNETDGVICKSQSEINEFFLDKGLWLYYQDDIYDLNNYTNPVKKNWRLQTGQCADVPRIIDLYFKTLIFIHDDNMFWTQQETFIGFMKERSEGLSDHVMVDSPVFSINLFSSKNNQKTQRKYEKIVDLLANIGGVMNILMFIGFLFTSVQNNLQMQNHIMNSLYDYPLEKKEKIPPKKRNQETDKLTEYEFDWNIGYEEVVNISAKNCSFQKEINSKTSKPLNDQTSISSKKKKNLKSTKQSSIELNQEVSQNKHIELTPSKQFEIQLQEPIKETIPKINPEPFKLPKGFQSNESFESEINKKLEPRKSKYTRFKWQKETVNEGNSPSNGPLHLRPESPKMKSKPLYSPEKFQNISMDSPLPKLKKDNTRMSLSIMDYMKMCLKKLFRQKLTTKEKLFLLSEEKYTQETDIVYILEKIQEFEKLKVLLLNEKQIDLFNLLAKPLIYLDEQKNILEMKSGYKLSKSYCFQAREAKRTNSRIVELKKHYHELTSQNILSQIDKNLLMLIEKNVFSQ